MIREIQKRVRERHPTGEMEGLGITLPNLLPVLHARDAAEGKVAAIGSVNPRPGGLINNIIQFVKRTVARSLNWHVREQVEFNKAVLGCVQAILDTQNEYNRALVEFSKRVQQDVAPAKPIAGQLSDLQAHWDQWRQGWEEKLNKDQIHQLRSISELQSAYHHRVTLMEAQFRETARLQHGDFNKSLDERGDEIHDGMMREIDAVKAQLGEMNQALQADINRFQQQMWADFGRMRDEMKQSFDKLVHDEVRMVRQKIASIGPVAAAAKDEEVDIDWLRFADSFRGPEEKIREQQQFYVDRFRGAASVLDLGCGRGEFLEVMREAGIPARGLDLSAECVNRCRNKGLDAELADVFPYLETTGESSLAAVHCAQVVEHLRPAELPKLIRLLAAKMKSRALVAIETPNPECLAILATHFYLDPTHVRPVPPALLAFYLKESGFNEIEVVPMNPAEETLPAVKDLPESVRKQFFGGMDYAIFARKL